MNFAEAIRNARVSSGITQQGLADRSGCSVHAIWEIEQGNGTVALLVEVLMALDVRIAGLPRGTSFGERLKTARERRGSSVEKLAARAGVSVMALRRLEKGNARIETLRRVMECLAPKARVSREVGGQWRGGERDCRFTPVPMLQQLYRIFGRINLDPCADPRSPVVAERFYYLEDDGLVQPWNADTVFCNPPYSRTTSFLRKAHDSWTAGECCVAILLLPAQTHLGSFHELAVGKADVFFLRGGVRFGSPDGPKDKAPFPCMFVVYGADDVMRHGIVDAFPCALLPKSDAGGVGRLAPLQFEAA